MTPRRWALALAAAVGLSSCGGGTTASEDVATLTLVDTVVDVRDAGADDFVAAAGGEALSLGDDVRTDPTGFGEIVYSDGSVTRVSENAVFRVAELAGAEDVPSIEVELDAGRAWNRVRDVAAVEDRFSVSTSVGVATVRGTGFDLNCTADGCILTVVEGSVSLTSITGDTADVQALTAIEVAADGTLGPPLELRAPFDPWIQRNLQLDVEDGFAAVDAPADPNVAGIGGGWEVTFTVTESNDPNAPRGASNENTWDIRMDCASGPCDGTITAQDVPLAPFSFAGGRFTIDEAGEQGTEACNAAGVIAYDRVSTGQLIVTHALAADPTSAVRFAGNLREVLTPRADAVASGCVEDVVITRDTRLVGILA